MSPDMIRDWAKQTIPALAFSATDEELESLAKLIGASTREQCAQACERAYLSGYSTLAAASLIRRGEKWTDTSTSPCTT